MKVRVAGRPHVFSGLMGKSWLCAPARSRKGKKKGPQFRIYVKEKMCVGEQGIPTVFTCLDLGDSIGACGGHLFRNQGPMSCPSGVEEIFLFFRKRLLPLPEKKKKKMARALTDRRAWRLSAQRVSGFDRQ